MPHPELAEGRTLDYNGHLSLSKWGKGALFTGFILSAAFKGYGFVDYLKADGALRAMRHGRDL